jgi:hypothetical protein
VLGGLGLDVSGDTVPYIAGWGEDGALDAVTQFAQLIDDLARRVEAALSAAGDTPRDGCDRITRPAWLGGSRSRGADTLARPSESSREVDGSADDRVSSGARALEEPLGTPASVRHGSGVPLGDRLTGQGCSRVRC